MCRRPRRSGYGRFERRRRPHPGQAPQAHDLDRAGGRATDRQQRARLKAKAQWLRDQIDQAGFQAT
ncbi:DUF6381 family protein [Streptomyces sp. NPDC056656]|uniref:DUF6381 family protein n=1 Tax=Streptomyces sp. NPDC056656 TaxID=3345895 RepID=UPI0036B08694